MLKSLKIENEHMNNQTLVTLTSVDGSNEMRAVNRAERFKTSISFHTVEFEKRNDRNEI